MKLKELLEKRAAEIRNQIEASTDANEVRELGETLKAILEELKALEEAENQGDGEGEGEGEGSGEANRKQVPVGAVLRNSAVLGGGNPVETNLEYRQAFMENVLHNTPIPAELRADANTLTSDVATVIPTELVNQIIEKFDNVGMILPLINKTSYAAGVVIPTSTVKPVATWVNEGAGSDRQKKTTGSITFTYHKLRCEISMSMEVGTMALSAFEAKFVENVAKAMTYAIENAVINGAGTASPKGILTETPANGQALTGTAFTFAKLVEAEGVLPAEYETGAKWCMNKKTFTLIQAMTDTSGQPIARVNYGISGSLERMINGREVVISPYVADNKAFMFDFSDYCLNTIYDMGVSKKQDWETEDYLTKAVMSVDGKVVDKGSLVTLTVNPSA